jgi:glyoxylase-like metal-dependent hydrolase (beta-lactamase superfamily II)
MAFDDAFASRLRALLRCIAALLLAIGASVAAQAAEARSESPGWYRTPIGRFTVTALWDGAIDFPVDQEFARPGKERLKALLARDHLSLKVPMSVNAFVIDSGQRVVMVDTGAGASSAFGSGLGKVLANLRAAGYTPGQVDEIYLTHTHTDHVGGLTADGRAVFTNAVWCAPTRARPATT